MIPVQIKRLPNYLHHTHQQLTYFPVVLPMEYQYLRFYTNLNPVPKCKNKETKKTN